MFSQSRFIFRNFCILPRSCCFAIHAALLQLLHATLLLFIMCQYHATCQFHPAALLSYNHRRWNRGAGWHVPPQKLKASNRAPQSSTENYLLFMHTYMSLVHVEQSEIAQQSLNDTVQFKLYSNDQTMINYTVIRHMIATEQQQNRLRVLRAKIPTFRACLDSI